MTIIDNTVSKLENDFTLYGGVDTNNQKNSSKVKFIQDHLKKFDQESQKKFWNFVKKFDPNLQNLCKIFVFITI